MKNLYRECQIIKRVLTECVNFLNTYSHTSSKLIIRDNNNYLIYIFDEYNDDLIFSLKISDNKAYLIHDYTNNSIIDKLIEARIPKEKFIILHQEKQDYIEYIFDFKKIYDRHQEYFTSDSNYQNMVLKPDLTATELKELRKLGLKSIDKAIALHPNTSPELLKELFTYFPTEVLNNLTIDLLLLENPQFLEELFNLKPDIFNRKDLKLPEYFLDWATNNEIARIRAAIASSHRMQYVNKLLDDSSCLVIQELSYNRNLDDKLKQQYREKKNKLKESCDKNDCPLNDWDRIPF